jgi:hypothetical protein
MKGIVFFFFFYQSHSTAKSKKNILLIKRCYYDSFVCSFKQYDIINKCLEFDRSKDCAGRQSLLHSELTAGVLTQILVENLVIIFF